jgi:hypothetical protein
MIKAGTAPDSVDSLVSVTGSCAPTALFTFTGDADRPARPLPCAGALSPATAAAAPAGVPRHRHPRPDPAIQARVEAFIVEQYEAGRSLRQLAELTDRSFSAVRNILTRRSVHRRSSGATVQRESSR